MDSVILVETEQYDIQNICISYMNSVFSTSSDTTHFSVYRFLQTPIFSYTIGGVPIYTYIMMLLTILSLAIITILEKSELEEKPTSISSSIMSVLSPASTGETSSIIGGRKKKGNQRKR